MTTPYIYGHGKKKKKKKTFIGAIGGTNSQKNFRLGICLVLMAIP